MKELRVRIKTWQEMEQEFHSTPSGIDIDFSFYFSKEMEALLPTSRVIVGINNDKGYLDWEGFGISSGMIKEYL